MCADRVPGTIGVAMKRSDRVTRDAPRKRRLAGAARPSVDAAGQARRQRLERVIAALAHTRAVHRPR
jgi:hypothetical protein